MNDFSERRILSSFFTFGFINEPVEPSLKEKIDRLDDQIKRFPIGSYGFFFFSTPSYVDVSESSDAVWIKIGYAHDGEKLLATQDLLERGWLKFEGVLYDKFFGSATLIGISKQNPICTISSNLLSTSIMNYFHDQRSFLVADNLRMMAMLLQAPALNEAVLPQHFLYRAVYGSSTYLRNVFKLTSGENLTWNAGDLSVGLSRDVRTILPNHDPEPVTSRSIDHFFNQFKILIGIYLENFSSTSATMLSGGVDSTLIQAAINQQQPELNEFPTLSYYLETECFECEIEYAKRAAQLLNTKHTFVRITPPVYRDYLVRSIEVLGHPPPDDVRPCFLMLTSNLPDGYGQLKQYFHGIDAEIFGVQCSLKVVQGDKYRNWPVPLLKSLSSLLRPVSASKSYGARSAAEIIETSRRPGSPDNFLNSEGMYTDYTSVLKSFSEQEITRAFTVRQALEKNYLGSDLFVEQLNTLDMLTDGINTTGIMNQLGNYSGISYIFPFADEMIIKEIYNYDPIERYTAGYRVKPMLKSALEAYLPNYDVNQPKGWSGIGPEHLFGWMRSGDLQDLVQDIERPGFMEPADFRQKIENPDWFTWSLFTLDLYQKFVLRP